MIVCAVRTYAPNGCRGFEFRSLVRIGAHPHLRYAVAGADPQARTDGIMANQFETQAQTGEVERRGPRGAVWVVVALYIFSALVLTSWAGGWGEENARASVPPPQHPQHQHAPQG